MLGRTKKLAVFMLLVATLEVMLGTADGFWRRRTRRRRNKSPPPPPPPKTTPPPPPKTPPPKRCDSSYPADLYRGWHSSWHGFFYYGCRSGYSLSQWHSHYRECQEDRIHQFGCRKINFYGKPTSLTLYCRWTQQHSNNTFSQCPNNGFIRKLLSVYDKCAKDRSFWMLCCWAKEYEHHDCRRIPSSPLKYINKFGTQLHFAVPRNYVLIGVGSYQTVSNTKRHDRLWQFKICKLTLKKKHE